MRDHDQFNMSCAECRSANVIINDLGNYAKCSDCGNLMMDFDGIWKTFPVEPGSRDMIEVSLGFTTIDTEPVTPKLQEAPTECFSCDGALECVQRANEIYCRCSRCGILTTWNGTTPTPVQVSAPGGGFNAEFQAIFEQNLGFTYKVRKRPIGVPED